MEIINLNTIPDGHSPVAHVSQNDEGRVTRFNLFDGVIPFVLDGTESVKLRIRKPNGVTSEILIVNTADSYVDIITTKQLTDVAGRVYCKLRINDLGTKSFYYFVESQP